MSDTRLLLLLWLCLCMITNKRPSGCSNVPVASFLICVTVSTAAICDDIRAISGFRLSNMPFRRRCLAVWRSWNYHVIAADYSGSFFYQRKKWRKSHTIWVQNAHLSCGAVVFGGCYRAWLMVREWQPRSGQCRAPLSACYALRFLISVSVMTSGSGAADVACLTVVFYQFKTVFASGVGFWAR